MCFHSRDYFFAVVEQLNHPIYVFFIDAYNRICQYNNRNREQAERLALVVLDHSVTCSGQTEWFFVYHKKPFYLLWNKAITITINWHSAITHITISNISSYGIPPFRRSKTVQPPCVQPWLLSDTYFTTFYLTRPYISGNIMNILAIYPIIQYCKK